MYVNNLNNKHTIPSFGKFIKIKGHTKEIDNFRETLRNKREECLTIAKQKNKNKSILYIFSGKHLDKFLDLMKKVYFRDLRTKPEKYLKEKPKTLKISKAKKYKNILKAKL